MSRRHLLYSKPCHPEVPITLTLLGLPFVPVNDSGSQLSEYLPHAIWSRDWKGRDMHD